MCVLVVKNTSVTQVLKMIKRCNLNTQEFYCVQLCHAHYCATFCLYATGKVLEGFNCIAYVGLIQNKL